MNEEFFRKVTLMRALQKEYFDKRKKETLVSTRRLEAEVDELIKQILLHKNPVPAGSTPDDMFVYSLTCPKQPGSAAIFYFDLQGFLRRVEWNHEVSDYFQRQIGKELPRRIEELERYRAVGCRVKDISSLDLSFDKFWNAYGYKVGKKQRAARLWNKLKREERIMAMGGIRKLKIFYDLRKYDYPYPERYISGRMWESEYNINK